jgi:hypothetical protein
VKSSEGFGAAGLPGCRVEGEGWRSDGDSRGEEKESRYSAMKKTSFNAQKVKRTFCSALAMLLPPQILDVNN